MKKNNLNSLKSCSIVVMLLIFFHFLYSNSCLYERNQKPLLFSYSFKADTIILPNQQQESVTDIATSRKEDSLKNYLRELYILTPKKNKNFKTKIY